MEHPVISIVRLNHVYPNKLFSPQSSVPLSKLDGHSFRAVDENQLARMKVHDLVASVEPICFELANFGFDIIDCKADMVHPDLVQVAYVCIRQWRGVLVAKELNLCSG